MSPNKKTPRILGDVKIDVKLKLSALWVAAMFCYLYADVKGLFKPGVMGQIAAGKAAGLQITQAFLLGSAVLMAVPAVMVFLSLALKPKANRWANIVLGTVYTAVIIATLLMPGVWAYYFFFGVVEIVLTVLIVWYAWRWPKQEA